MFSLGTKIAAAVALAAILASGVLGWQLKESLKREGAAEAALSTAVAANKSNLDTIARLEGDAVIAQAVAIADAQARRKTEDENHDLKQAIADAGAEGCAGLDALIARRRLQRQAPGRGANEGH